MDNRSEAIQFLRTQAATSSFFQSLLDQFQRKGMLSDRQMDCVYRALEKAKAPKPQAQEADLTAIHQMFDTARSNGLKKLAYRANGLTIKPAAATGRNPGALYVFANDQYIGKVVDKGFFPTREATDDQKGELTVIAKDPLEVARLWGMKTGECSCCGRELTNEESVTLGIGPICRKKWFNR